MTIRKVNRNFCSKLGQFPIISKKFHIDVSIVSGFSVPVLHAEKIDVQDWPPKTTGYINFDRVGDEREIAGGKRSF